MPPATLRCESLGKEKPGHTLDIWGIKEAFSTAAACNVRSVSMQVRRPGTKVELAPIMKFRSGASWNAQ